MTNDDIPLDVAEVGDHLVGKGYNPDLAVDYQKFFAALADHFGMRPSAEVCKTLCGHLTRLPLMRVEDRPIGATLIVGSPIVIAKCLPSTSVINPPDGVNVLTGLDDLRDFYDAHDESAFAFCFDDEGNLDSIRRLYNPQIGEGVSMITRLTEVADVTVFHAAKWQRSFRVYHAGGLDVVGTLLENTGAWDLRFLPANKVKELAGADGMSLDLVWTILDLAFELTYVGHGALIVLGDPSDAMPKDGSRFQIVPTPLVLISRTEFVDIAKQDGAVLISSKGWLMDAAFMLRPSINDAPPQDFIGHSRHTTAFRISKQEPGLVVFAISKNKKITVFMDGDDSTV